MQICYIVGFRNTLQNETGDAPMELGVPLRVIEVVPEPKPVDLPGKTPVEPNPQQVPVLEKIGA